jgi:hypothetical protein
LGEEFVTWQQAHFDWVLANGLNSPWVDDWIQAELVPHGWAPVDCSAGLSAEVSFLADYPPQDGRGGQRCSLDVRPAYLLLAELRHD